MITVKHISTISNGPTLFVRDATEATGDVATIEAGAVLAYFGGAWHVNSFLAPRGTRGYRLLPYGRLASAVFEDKLSGLPLDTMRWIPAETGSKKFWLPAAKDIFWDAVWAEEPPDGSYEELTPELLAELGGEYLAPNGDGTFRLARGGYAI